MKKISKQLLYIFLIPLLSILFIGCGAQQANFNYTTFKTHHPKSILILPPVNNTSDIKASDTVYSYTTFPLAESGYYVFPIPLVKQTFQQNGFSEASEIQNIPHSKLHEIFHADAVMYINVKSYGSTYNIISSNIVVTLEGKLVDLKTSSVLWSGTASANSSQNSSGGGLVGLLITSLVTQILNSSTDATVKYADLANVRLLHAGKKNGILFGHRSPKFKSD
jgi:hypothetical protein